MKEIELTRGFVALVDDEDFEKVSAYSWYAKPTKNYPNLTYAERSDWINGRKTRMKMHRLIMGAPAGVVVDHINGNCLDNRRSNLRLCRQKMNIGARRNNKNNTSGYRGVNLHSGGYGYAARVGGKYIGHFKDIVEAARARDEAAIEIYGEFAVLNFPEEK